MRGVECASGGYGLGTMTPTDIEREWARAVGLTPEAAARVATVVADAGGNFETFETIVRAVREGDARPDPWCSQCGHHVDLHDFADGETGPCTDDHCPCFMWVPK